MAAAMQSQWDKLARPIVDMLQPLLAEGKWGAAQEYVNRIDLSGVVRGVESKIEELCVSALIFGAHHVTGSTRDTTVMKTKVLPPQVKVAVDQLVHMVEADGRDYLCNYLHQQIEAAKQADPRQHVQKMNPYHDEEGLFTTTDGAAGGGARKTFGGLPTTRTVAEALQHLKNMPRASKDREWFDHRWGDEIDTNDLPFAKPVMQAAVKKVGGEPDGYVKVPMAGLKRGPQSSVTVGLVAKKIKEDTGEAPEYVYTIGGPLPGLNQLSGHHRMAAAAMMGATDVRIGVYVQQWDERKQTYRDLSRSAGIKTLKEKFGSSFLEANKRPIQKKSVYDAHVPDTDDMKEARRFAVNGGHDDLPDQTTKQVQEEEKARGQAKWRYPSLVKDELTVEQLEETGGLQEPEQGQTLKRKRGQQKLTKKDGKKTLYVNRPLLNAWVLIAWADSQGFKNVQRPEDMHVTICYSKEPFDWDDLEPKMDNVTIVGGRRGIQVFGEAVVLTFDSKVLASDHQELLDAGASYDFDEYRPHVSITWTKPDDELLAKMNVFEGNLQFGPEEFAPINKDWKEDHEEIVLRKADQALADMLNDAVLKGKKVPISTAASLTTSRLISLGFLDQAMQSGMDQYQVTEVLDDRTCPVCQYMHGKIFSVAAQHSRVMQALGVDDPAASKTIAPWPGQSSEDMKELRGMSLEEMQDAGYGSPPYHPGCRGFLVPLGSVDTTIPLGGDDDEQQQPISEQPALADLFDAITGDGAALEAERAAPAVKEWTRAEVEALQWQHLQITDPAVFKLANDAFEAGDYDECARLTDEYLAAHVVVKEEPFDGPNGPKKRKRPQSPGGFERDYDDVTNDTPNTFGVLDEVTTMNDNLAPLDR